MMSDINSSARSQHLAVHWLTWTALRHFLPVPLLRELIGVVVRKTSNGTLTFDDLFEERCEPSLEVLETWAVRARTVASPTASYLQRRVQYFLWQTDADVFPPDDVGLEKDREGGPIDLEAAVRLGAADFGLDRTTLRDPRLRGEKSLQVLAELVEAAGGMVRSPSTASFVNQLRGLLDQVESPLAIVMTKHLGDLCADADEWSKASALYDLANEKRAKILDGPWHDYGKVLGDILLQSIATCSRVTDHARTSLAQLHDALSKASLATRPLLSLNAPFDAIVAQIQTEEPFRNESARRATLVLPPLYQGTHDLASVTLDLVNEQFLNAQRACWGVLRRQIALGLASQTRTTKVVFARTLLAMLEHQAGARVQPMEFEMAVRLLVESGDSSSTQKLVWPDTLVTTYVKQRIVEYAIDIAGRYNGAQTERQMVVIELFQSWLLILPADRSEVAHRMLSYISDLAQTGKTTIFANQDLGGRSLDVLKALAERRPEFRRDNRDEVRSVVLSKLESSTSWHRQNTALELAMLYVDVFSDEQIKELTEKTLALLALLNAAVQVPVVRPAMELLTSGRVAGVSRTWPALGKHVLDTILRFGTQQGTESASLIFYLRDFDPALLAQEPIIAAVRPVVASLRSNVVTNVNSTATVGQIQALLLSPTISGPAGVDDALSSLLQILGSSDSNQFLLALPHAYAAVMMLVDRQDEFAAHLSTTRADIDKRWNEIYSAILGMWNSATSNPLILLSFAIPPPTKPNPTIVHNWAFASLRFAESLGRRDEMIEALQSAMKHEMLRDSIALALAISPRLDADVDIDPSNIGLESADVFYSALGRRLAVLPRLDAETELRLCRALLEQCFRYGPRGLDAAVLVYGARLGLAGNFESDAAANYVKRVERSRELRLPLLPLVESINLKP